MHFFFHSFNTIFFFNLLAPYASPLPVYTYAQWKTTLINTIALPCVDT